jgi:hypothetical protein
MTYGEWTEAMTEAARSVVAGKVVYDLGAGRLGHSRRLLELGAEHVFAVDKEKASDAWWRGKPITFVQTYFDNLDVPDRIEVALVAWPTNHRLTGLIDILERCERVIYLGSNCNGDMCGWPGMWDYLHFREIEAHVPHHKNSLIIYGRHLGPKERRPMVGEEVGATCGMFVRFDEAQRLAAEVAEVVSSVRRSERDDVRDL